MRTLLVLALATPLVAAAPAAQPRFDPIVFFTGHTEGTGRLKVALHAAQVVDVHGDGAVDPDGTLVLDQRVERYDMPARSREWRIRRVAPGRYAGTLTDAIGPVTIVATGDTLRIAYRMKGRLSVSQVLTLSPDGRSAHNVLHIHKLGLPVAALDETIRREGG